MSLLRLGHSWWCRTTWTCRHQGCRVGLNKIEIKASCLAQLNIAASGANQ